MELVGGQDRTELQYAIWYQGRPLGYGEIYANS